MDEGIKNRTFFQIVDNELKRAERYQIFVSMVILDLTVLRETGGGSATDVFEQMFDLVRRSIRVVDQASRIGSDKIVLLLPETSRQGAEMAARRLSEMIREGITRAVANSRVSTIPVEMASFPDAAGARSVKEVLQEMTHTSMN